MSLLHLSKLSDLSGMVHYYPQVNPYFIDEEMIKIQQELRKHKINK